MGGIKANSQSPSGPQVIGCDEPAWGTERPLGADGVYSAVAAMARMTS